MAGSARNTQHAVEWLHKFEADPEDFGFLAALRKLEALYEDKPRFGESARLADDPIRLGQDPSLAFAPTGIARFKTGTGNKPDRLAQFFFGLFGPNGPMPLHISEYVYSREANDGDKTFRKFADIFHHRMTCLFYRAAVNGEPTYNFDRPDDNRFDLYIGAILGIGPHAFRNRDAMPDRAKLHNAARFALQTKPAEGLCDVLEEYFGLPFSIEEFVGEWLAVDENDRLSLGRNRQGGILGISTVLGSEIWSCQHKFRIVCGPLSLADFRRLLPGSRSVDSMLAAVRNYIGDEYAWDIQLRLKKEEVPSTVLGADSQLGWTSWLGEHQGNGSADDVIINLQH